MATPESSHDTESAATEKLAVGLPLDPEIRKEMRDYAWKYFSLHADQRIKTFNFYLVIATFAVGGMLTLIKDSGNRWAVAPIAFLLAFLSFIFWKLDSRNKQLIRHGEMALRYIEAQSEFPNDGPFSHVLNIFMHEQHVTDKLKGASAVEGPEAHMTYSDCFNAVFLTFGFMSVAAAIAALIA